MSKFGIGQAVRRVEDRRFTTGSGQFVADLSLPRQCYGVPLLSPHAHAIIRRVDVSAAKAAPGVLAVLTGADAATDKIGGIPPFFMPDSWGGPPGFSTTRPVLLGDRVRCLGDRVAFVVAETEAQARDASELIAVDYEPLPAVVDLEQAAQPSAPKVWEHCPHGNIAATIAFGDKAATDAVDFEKLMDRCLTLADWDGFPARRRESERRGLRRGRAVTPYIELGGVMNDRMEIRFDPGGAVSIIAGTHSHGQGHATAFAQLVSEWLGVPFEAINYIQGDTESVSFGRGTYAARSSLVGGNGLRLAADAVIARGKAMAAALMEAAPDDIEFKAGTFTVAGTDKRMAIGDAARAFFAPAGPVIKLGLGLEGVGTYSGVPGGAPNYPNGCQVCEVEVDPETGAVRIDRFVAVDDVGMVINPMICEGQIHGGIAQGVGQALVESVIYEQSSGQLMTGSFLDYAMPRADDLPSVVSDFVEIPAKTNPLGIKGIGEAGTIAAPPTVVNAVLDALRELGVAHLDMPLTPARIWQAIRTASDSPARADGHTR
jgi:CO/xanthine dehydrogenase Mo-binding subunit